MMRLCLPALVALLAGMLDAQAADAARSPGAEEEVPAATVRFDTDGAQRAEDGVQKGNPLWAIPLETLSATRDRPLFTPSRRPPAAPLAPPPAVAAPPPPPPPPAQPRLKLIGTVVSPVDSFGIFLDPGSNKVLRLRTGEVHDGWTLRTVSLRDVTLRSGSDSAVLALPVRQASDSAPGRSGGAGGSVVAARPGGQVPAAHSIIVPRRAPPSPLEDYPDH